MYPFHTVRRIVKDKLFDFKMIFQRLYRHDHVAKVDIWNAHAVIIKKIYPLIKAFVKFDLHGYPSSVKSMKEWRKILNEILFAFEKRSQVQRVGCVRFPIPGGAMKSVGRSR